MSSERRRAHDARLEEKGAGGRGVKEVDALSGARGVVDALAANVPVVEHDTSVAALVLEVDPEGRTEQRGRMSLKLSVRGEGGTRAK